MPNTPSDPSAPRAIVPASSSSQRALEVRANTSIEGVVLERPIALKVATSLTLPLLCVAFFLNFVDLRGDLVSPARVITYALLFVALFWPLAMSRKAPVRRRVKLETAADGLRVDGQLVLPSDRLIAAGITSRREGRPVVAVLGRNRLPPWWIGAAVSPPDFTIELDDDAAAGRLFRGLGQDLSSRTTDITLFRVTSIWQVLVPLLPFFGLVAAIFSAVFWLLLGPSPIVENPVVRSVLFATLMLLSGAVLMPMYVSFAQWLGRTRVVVGRDGVRLGKRSERFIPFSEIKEVFPWTKRKLGEVWLEIELRSGERVRVARCVGAPHDQTRQPAAVTVGDPRVDLIGERIREGLNAYASSSALETKDPSLFVRSGRTISDWISNLRALGGGGYRSSSIAFEWLTDLVADPSQTPEIRVGAAIVLRSVDQPDVARPIERAAQTTASAELCTVLEAIAVGVDDTTLEPLVESATSSAIVRQ